jgi:tRNA G26 N,N-dimethylase Trm1
MTNLRIFMVRPVTNVSAARSAIDRAGSELGSKVLAYDPQWKGPITTEESIKKVLAVIDKASIEDGNAGDFLSHLGNRHWV